MKNLAAMGFALLGLAVSTPAQEWKTVPGHVPPALEHLTPITSNSFYILLTNGAVFYQIGGE